MTVKDAEAAPAPPSAVDTAPASRLESFRQWYLVVVLTTIYTLNFVDRGALNLIVNPIKDDLHVSDVQMSLLLGLSFVTLYSLLSIPAGYLADFVSRRMMIGSAVFFWSCMASMCGFAGNYWQLFAGRVGLGVGEAALPPAAYSLIRDGVPARNRGRAFSIYQCGPLLGGGIGALVGGTLYALVGKGALAGIPVIGHLKAWQVVIAVPGLCGILISSLLLTVREPPRATPVDRASAAGFGEMFAYLRLNWRLYLPVFGAVTTVSLAGGGWGAWMAAALGRIWGLSPSQIGPTVGSFSLILFPLSAFGTGFLMDYFKKRRHPDAPLKVSLVASLLHIAPALFILQAPSVHVMWVSYGISVFFNAGVQLACGITLADVTPGRLMGKVTSFYFLISNLLGLALGPTVFAVVSEYGFEGPSAIAHAMTLCYALFMAITVVLLYWGAGEVRRWARLNDAKPTHLRHTD